MNRRFVDLSITLCNDVVSDPPFLRPEITYQTHSETLAELAHFFPGVTQEQTPDGAGFAAAEWVRLTTHSGTHLDAPWHFHPTQDRVITVREASRLQSIPDSVEFPECMTTSYKLIGNAVPPLLAKAIAEHLASVLADDRAI